MNQELSNNTTEQWERQKEEGQYLTGGYCKGNPLHFRLPLVFRFRFRLWSVLRFRSRHLVSLLQRLRSNDILCHLLPTRFRSRSHDVA